MLKSAWEIALEKQEKYEELSQITTELLEHVALLEEGWRVITPPDRDQANHNDPEEWLAA